MVLRVADYLRKGAPYPPSGYDELDTTLMPPRGQEHYRITPSPGGPASQYGKFVVSYPFFLSYPPVALSK